MSTGTISILFPLYTLSQHALAHSEKFKTNEEVDSLLSEKMSNLPLTCKVNSITVGNNNDNKSGDLLHSPNNISKEL